MNQKRPYCLTAAGLESLRASAAKHRPWLKSTGPTSEAGRGRSSKNATKHGQRGRLAREAARAASSRGRVSLAEHIAWRAELHNELNEIVQCLDAWFAGDSDATLPA